MRAPVPKTLASIPLAIVLSGPSIGETAPFPAPLIGKSVIVNWTTNRQQKFEGTDEVVFRSRGSTLNVYISTAGRAFSREVVVRPGRGGGGGRRGGGGGSGGGGGPNTESTQAPDESKNSTGGTRIVHFEGGALLVDNPLIAGARRVTIIFDTGYTSCSARVIFGREDGTGPIRQRSVLTGRRFEVMSVQTSAPSCAVKPGNVFGGQ